MSAFALVQIPAVAPADTTNNARTAASGAATVTTLQIAPEGRTKVGLVRAKIKHVAGSAATFAPRIHSDAASTTAGDIDQEFAGTATAVATLFDPTINEPIWMYTDELGRLYFIPAPNAGSDNTFDYCFRFLVAR